MTHDRLKIIKVTQLTLHFKQFNVKHPEFIVDKIARKFIIGNDFMTQYKCDLLNSANTIVFGGEQVPYKLLRSTVYSICSIICSKNLIYQTVWENNTLAFTRRERTLRDQSDSLVRTNNFEGKPNT